MADLYKAIRTIHNEAITINGNRESDIIAWDKDGNEISINWTNVNAWVDPNEYQYKREKEYPSITKAAEAYGLKSGTVRKRINNGKSIPEAFDLIQ